MIRFHLRTGPKYHNKITEYDGQTYHSQGEANYAAELNLRKRAGDIKDWRRQVKIPLEVYGRLVTTYIADFAITHRDGTTEIVETKGYLTTEGRLKWALFEAIYAAEHPEVKTTMQMI